MLKAYDAKSGSPIALSDLDSLSTICTAEAFVVADKILACKSNGDYLATIKLQQNNHIVVEQIMLQNVPLLAFFADLTKTPFTILPGVHDNLQLENMEEGDVYSVGPTSVLAHSAAVFEQY